MVHAASNLAERYETTPYPRQCGGCQVYRYNTGRGVRGDINGDGDKLEVVLSRRARRGNGGPRKLDPPY